MKKIFQATFSSESLYAEIGESGMKYTPPCPACDRNEKRLKPFSVKFMDNRLLGDFCWLSPDVFVSSKCKGILESLNETSFAFERPIVVGERQEDIWCLDIKNKYRVSKECGTQLLEKCNVCGNEFFSTWLGGLKVADKYVPPVFRLYEYSGFVLVTEVFANLVLENKLTNIKFVPLIDVVDEFAWLRPFR